MWQTPGTRLWRRTRRSWAWFHNRLRSSRVHHRRVSNNLQLGIGWILVGAGASVPRDAFHVLGSDLFPGNCARAPEGKIESDRGGLRDPRARGAIRELHGSSLTRDPAP